MATHHKSAAPSFQQIVYLDLDGVIVNFLGSERIPAAEKLQRNHPEIYKPGFFADLLPNPGALASVRALMLSGKYEVWIATRPLHKSSHCYTEKIQWIMRYLPELTSRVIMTQDKGLLRGHYLIDDETHWYGKFDGTFILFNPEKPKQCWDQVLEHLL